MGLSYFHEVRTHDNLIVSLDMLTLDFDFWYDGDCGQKFLSLLESNFWLEYKYFMNTSSGNFRYQFVFQCQDSRSFWLGVGLNTFGKPEFKRCRLQFNPNKVGDTVQLIWVLNTLISLCKRPVIRNFDVAIDYPVLRSNVFMVKDRRTYQEYSNSQSDRTQYLGQRSHHGFCKLYNKQLESDLNYPLSRLEITVDFDWSSWREFQVIFPKVRVLNDIQLAFDHVNLVDTDRYILYTALDNYEMLSLLGRKKRKKIECILVEYTQVLKIDQIVYEEIIHQMQYFVNRIDTDVVYNPFEKDMTMLLDWEVPGA